MCRKPTITTTATNMVTPTKVKSRQQQHQPHHHRGKGWTPPPPASKQAKHHHGHHSPHQPTTYTNNSNYQQYTSHSGASTPSRGSPCFAGSKCFEPPTPDSLPKPPTSWTPTKPAKKQLNFGDTEAANQHLRMLLNVQA